MGAHTYTEGGFLEIIIDLVNPCDDPVSLTDPGQIDPANYYYTGSTPAVQFVLTPFVVDPSICTVTYACLSNTGTRTDLCSASEATFDPTSGHYELASTDLGASGFLPGTYVITI